MVETSALLEGETGLRDTSQRQHGELAHVLPPQPTDDHLTGAGDGAFTCLTGDGDCCRPPIILETKDGGDLEVGFGGMRGGVL